MNLASFLISMVKPLIAQILVSLGLSIITFGGIQMILTQLNGHIQNSLNGLPVVVSNLFGLAGVGEALGIIVGAFAFRLSMGSFKRIDFKSK